MVNLEVTRVQQHALRSTRGSLRKRWQAPDDDSNVGVPLYLFFALFTPRLTSFEGSSLRGRRGGDEVFGADFQVEFQVFANGKAMATKSVFVLLHFYAFDAQNLTSLPFQFTFNILFRMQNDQPASCSPADRFAS